MRMSWKGTTGQRLPGTPKDPESATQGPDAGLPRVCRTGCLCSCSAACTRIVYGMVCSTWAKPLCQEAYRILNRWRGCASPYARKDARSGRQGQKQGVSGGADSRLGSIHGFLRTAYMPAPRRLDARHCSGKAKRHATKTRYATAHGGLILQYIDSRRWGQAWLCRLQGERAHVFREPPAPAGDRTRQAAPKIHQVLGRQRHAGMGKMASQHTHMSGKRKSGKKIIPAEKEYKAPTKIQIRLDHAIRRAKAVRMMGDMYRNPRKNIRT